MTDTETVDQELDITKEVCPMTFVRTRLALDRMRPGQVLRVQRASKATKCCRRRRMPMASPRCCFAAAANHKRFTRITAASEPLA
jgi:Sulfurtransferase TusA